MLEDLKLLLGMDPEEELDSTTEKKLKLLLNYAEKKLLNMLGGIEDLPVSMEHIIVEVAVKRFNRIGSEGMDSHSLEGESISFSNDDFAEFENEIANYLDVVRANSRRGGFRFV